MNIFLQRNKMIFTKILYFLLASDIKGNKTYYYKMISHKKHSGCVEAYTTGKMAKAFNAQKGTCFSQNCTIFKGIYKIPFCCDLHGYECDGMIL